MLQPFTLKRRVSYHETDAMGVVHHSNHVKYFEDARVEWLRSRGYMAIHAPYGDLVFAVTKLSTRYFKPLAFDEAFEILVQSKMQGVRVHFQYAIYSLLQKAIVATGDTELVPLTKDFRPSRLPDDMQKAYKLEPWDSEWPPQNWPAGASASVKGN